MAAETFDIFASLRHKVTGGRGGFGGRNKLFVEFRTPDLEFRVDDDLVAKTTAEAIALTMRTNMLRGLDPSGRPLPQVAQSTIARREARVKQFQRGGRADSRYSEKGYPDARKNFRKRFSAPRVPGGPHEPSAASLPRNRIGVESGLLARSIAAGKERPGVYGVYFANVRAVTDKSGKAAVQRVFEQLGVWTQEAMRQPLIQEALKQTAQSIIVRKRKESLADFGRALSQTTKSVIGLGKDLSDLGI
jgi:hypothetical protein